MTGDMLFMQYHTPTSPLPVGQGGGKLMTSLPVLLFKEVRRSGLDIHNTHRCDISVIPKIIIAQRKNKTRRLQGTEYASEIKSQSEGAKFEYPHISQSRSKLVLNVHQM